ncbi:hypothetical protein [Paenibacillus sp. JJ-223]|nr:hypothetical protein [Paenibacillus sp. JJ-223]CAH1191270.1 hypothetical protein PAECIP111890_00379 [Paenibacillus sp. JJ-223]
MVVLAIIVMFMAALYWYGQFQFTEKMFSLLFPLPRLFRRDTKKSRCH